MRFLADENIPSNIVNWLIAEGHDVVSARITGAGTKDEQWLSLAVPEERIIITADKDFGELIFRDGLAAYGIILLRLDDVYPGNGWNESKRLGQSLNQVRLAGSSSSPPIAYVFGRLPKLADRLGLLCELCAMCSLCPLR